MMELEDHICKSEQTIYLIPEHSKLALLMLQKNWGDTDWCYILVQQLDQTLKNLVLPLYYKYHNDT